ncbi:MAG TPA: hypothetical protein VGL38_09445 [bacterium]|jgi:hypothetical protein
MRALFPPLLLLSLLLIGCQSRREAALELFQNRQYGRLTHEPRYQEADCIILVKQAQDSLALELLRRRQTSSFIMVLDSFPKSVYCEAACESLYAVGDSATILSKAPNSKVAGEIVLRHINDLSARFDFDYTSTKSLANYYANHVRKFCNLINGFSRLDLVGIISRRLGKRPGPSLPYQMLADSLGDVERQWSGKSWGYFQGTHKKLSEAMSTLDNAVVDVTDGDIVLSPISLQTLGYEGMIRMAGDRVASAEDKLNAFDRAMHEAESILQYEQLELQSDSVRLAVTRKLLVSAQ